MIERRRLVSAIVVVAAIPLAIVTSMGEPERSLEVWIPKKPKAVAAAAAPTNLDHAIAAATAAAGTPPPVSEAPKPPPAPKTTPPEAPHPTPGVVVGMTAAEPIVEGKTVLWTAGFQAAWDGLAERFAADTGLEMGDPAKPENVKAMNAGKFPAEALDPLAVVTVYGTADEKAWKSIERAMKHKRPEDAPPAVEKDILAYARVDASVRYDVPFARASAPLPFGAKQTPVHAYGLLADAPDASPVDRLRRAQIVVHAPPAIPEAETSKTAVIELKAALKARVVISGRKPKATLEETWTDVAAILAGPGASPAAGSRIAIPRVMVDSTRSYPEFVPGTIPGENATLLFARQDVILTADERGVVGAEPPAKADDPGGTKFDLAIDGPFLLAVLAPGADRPYILLWVGTDEVLSR